jgi:hypothetical protein
MAKRIDDYTNSTPADASYPGGSFKNTSGPATSDGTPVDKDWANDILGFREAVLDEAGIVHSGVPDTATASDVLDGLKVLFPDKTATDTHVAAVAPHSGHVSHSLATAADDFLVASGVGVFVKKTLAQVKAILGLGDSAYKNTGTTAGTVSAGDHDHDADYVTQLSMASSLAANGYQKFHSGLIIQWGTANIGNIGGGAYAWESAIVFPIAFGATANVQVSKLGEGAWTVVGVRSMSLTGFTAYAEETGSSDQTGLILHWMAIGWA